VPAGGPVRHVTVRYRRASLGDADAIAALHADSWRRNYRGAFSDAFLDGDVVSDRLHVWRERLSRPQPTDRTVVAEDAGAVVGFAHTVLDDDPTWGALLDNLHVTHERRGHGIGSGLLAVTAAIVVEDRPSSGLYLWVLEQNEAAQAFYEARGGTCAGRQPSEPPGGGTAIVLRYAWPDPSTLLAGGR
jgi:ribosomal protein S18 acetylase RimI-like enzyme